MNAAHNDLNISAMTIQILPLENLDDAAVAAVTDPFTCTDTYQVIYSDAPGAASFELRLVPLAEPHVHHYNHFDAETIERYRSILPEGFSFGAYDGEQLVGMVIAEKRDWNNSLWVNEFHVAEAYRGQGIGRQLMEAAAEKAKAAHLRTIVCETQNQNTLAIAAYRKLGFKMEGVDISYYTNEDYPDRGIAVFMKRRL